MPQLTPEEIGRMFVDNMIENEPNADQIEHDKFERSRKVKPMTGKGEGDRMPKNPAVKPSPFSDQV